LRNLVYKTMLERKFSYFIEDYLSGQQNKILLVNGARQIGKSFIIRYVGNKLFKNFIEIDLRADSEKERIFADVTSLDSFYLQLSSIVGNRLGEKKDTLVFLDEIQVYPQLLTLLKFLNQDGRYTYIASGSQLGIALSQTPSVPLGSVSIKQMYPLDMEEFFWAMGVGKDVIESARNHYRNGEPIPEPLHNHFMRLFRYYMLTGGLPDAVNRFVEDKNIQMMRDIQNDIHTLYGIDASQYDRQQKLKIRRVYDIIPSNLESRKKRVIVSKIENKKGKQFSDYENEFDYLVQSGIALQVDAISNPRFPLLQSVKKNLLKLYLNDVGILTALLYQNNIKAIMNDECSINLGTVYESVVAQELNAHGFKLYYYDNKKSGEVDFLVDDFDSLSIVPIEVKSGKDYYVHSALNMFVDNEEYGIKKGIVLSNTREVTKKDKILYLPIYYIMFFSPNSSDSRHLLL